MAVHPDVIWGIRESGGGLLSGEQRAIGVRIQGVAAEEAVVAKNPQVLGAGNRRSVGDLKFVRGVRTLVRRVERLNTQVDLRDRSRSLRSRRSNAASESSLRTIATLRSSQLERSVSLLSASM
jgi:hypothetical protein